MPASAEMKGYRSTFARICRNWRIPPKLREDLRHRITEVALGEIRSSTTFSRPDFDKIFAIFRGIEEHGPSFVATQRDLRDAEDEGERRRLIWCLEQRVDSGYVASVAHDMYMTPAWRDLPSRDLLNLLRTVQNRCRANPNLRPSRAGAKVPSNSQTSDNLA